MIVTLRLVWLWIFVSVELLLLVGCSKEFGLVSSGVSQTTLGPIRGVVYGGQNPIGYASINVYQASTSGYSAASVLLTPSPIISDSGGNFVLTGEYTCTEGQQVYLYATGGDPGAGTNTAVGLMTVLGTCPTTGTFAGRIPYIYVNEVTTIAAAYAMAPFAADATHVGGSGTALGLQGLTNAFANAAKLVAPVSGAALSTTPGGNGIVPQTQINTLANILASCINSIGPGSAACGALLRTATSDGTSSGVAPRDTATAAINIARNPGSNVAGLYVYQLPNSPFFPATKTQPNDFTIGISYTGGGLADPFRVAVDGDGDVWVTNLAGGSVSKFSGADGTAISPSVGYKGGGLNEPIDIAIDSAGNAWIANAGNNTVTELSGLDGSAISPPTGYRSDSLDEPYGIAIDGKGNIWVTNLAGSSITVLSGIDGSGISPIAGYTSGGLCEPIAIALDNLGDAWITNAGNSTVTKLSGIDGSAVSPSGGYIGGGIEVPYSIAIDSTGAVWISNLDNSVTKLSGVDGSAVSPSSGYMSGLSAPYGIAIDGAGNAWIADYGNSVTELSGSSGAIIPPSVGYAGGSLNRPSSVAIDGSGDVWVANAGNYTVTQLIGVATPVVTPLATGVRDNKLGARP